MNANHDGEMLPWGILLGVHARQRSGVAVRSRFRATSSAPLR